MRLCEIPNCGRPHLAKGYCRQHYDTFGKYGDPLHPIRSRVTKPIRSDNLSLAPLSFGLEASIITVMRRLPSRATREFLKQTEDMKGG